MVLNITHNIEVHCISQRIGWLTADFKVVQKGAQNLKIMWSGHMSFCGLADMLARTLIGA